MSFQLPVADQLLCTQSSPPESLGSPLAQRLVYASAEPSPQTQLSSVSRSVSEIQKNEIPAVLALYHIGSLGTFTQSIGSDFDYWVIVDKKKLSKDGYHDLKKTGCDC